MESNLLANCRVVLVGPMFGGNVGASARVIKNTGLGVLHLVAPEYEDENEARKFCHGAEDVYEGRQVFDGLVDAVAGCKVVAGFTVRERHRRRYVSVREFARRWVEDAVASEAAPSTALLFGRERDGLSNADVDLCSDLVWIPSHPDHASYNLAQAVLLAGYELLSAQLAIDPQAPKARPRMTRKPPASKLAPAEELDELLAHLREAFLRSGYAYEHTVDHMLRSYQEIFARAGLYSREVQMLRGLARQIKWLADQVED